MNSYNLPLTISARFAAISFFVAAETPGPYGARSVKPSFRLP